MPGEGRSKGIVANHPFRTGDSNVARGLHDERIDCDADRRLSVTLFNDLLRELVQIESIAALAGTAHGRLLLAKLAVLVPILGLAIVNRTRILPALSGSGGRPPMHRLAAFVGGEAVLALVLLALADDLGEHYDSGKT